LESNTCLPKEKVTALAGLEVRADSLRFLLHLGLSLKLLHTLQDSLFGYPLGFVTIAGLTGFEQYADCRWPMLEVKFTHGKQNVKKAVSVAGYLKNRNSQNDTRQRSAESPTTDVKKERTRIVEPSR